MSQHDEVCEHGIGWSYGCPLCDAQRAESTAARTEWLQQKAFEAGWRARESTNPNSAQTWVQAFAAYLHRRPDTPLIELVETWKKPE